MFSVLKRGFLHEKLNMIFMYNTDKLDEIVRDVVLKFLKEKRNGGVFLKPIPVAVSNRHVHLEREDLEALFGKGYNLNKMKDLSQPGQYAANETVDLIGPKDTIKGVRVLGPERKFTQAEISITDSFKLGIKAVPVKESGDIEGTPGITISGPAGAIRIEKGVIAAKRHIHMTPEDGGLYGVSDKQIVKAVFKGPRAAILDEVVIRINKDFSLELHMDMDEANGIAIGNEKYCDIVK